MSKRTYKTHLPDRNDQRWQEKQRQSYLQSLWEERADDSLSKANHEFLRNFAHPLLEYSDFVPPGPRVDTGPELVIPLTIDRPEHALDLLHISLIHSGDIGIHVIASPDQSSEKIEQELEKFVRASKDLKKILIVGLQGPRPPRL